MPFLILFRVNRGEILDFFFPPQKLKSHFFPHLHLLVTNWENFLDKTSYWSHLLVDVLTVLKVHSSTPWVIFFLASEHEKTACLVLISCHPPLLQWLYVYVSVWPKMRECRSFAKKLPTSTFPSPPVFSASLPWKSGVPASAYGFILFPAAHKSTEPVWKFEERTGSEDWVSSKSSRLQTQKETSFGEGSASRICSSLFPWANRVLEANNRVAGR